MKENKKSDSTEDNKQEANKDFPGYPHYRGEEDIMSRSKRETADVDNLSGSETPVLKDKAADSGLPLENETPQTPAADSLKKKEGFYASTHPDESDEIELVEGTDADVTEEEADELERDGLTDHNFHPSELDIPGAELDDEAEDIGEEDEENNYYSLGGDDKENLEENPDR